MLYFVCYHGTFQWHVSERLPNFAVPSLKEIQADGDELDYILSFQLTTCEFPTTERVFTWRNANDVRAIYKAMGGYVPD